MRRYFRGFFRCSFRPEVASDVIYGTGVGQVGLNGPVKFGDFSSNGLRDIYSSETVGFGIFARFLNIDNCQPEVVSYVISGTTDQDIGMAWMYVPILVILS